MLRGWLDTWSDVNHVVDSMHDRAMTVRLDAVTLRGPGSRRRHEDHLGKRRRGWRPRRPCDDVLPSRRRLRHCHLPSADHAIRAASHEVLPWSCAARRAARTSSSTLARASAWSRSLPAGLASPAASRETRRDSESRIRHGASVGLQRCGAARCLREWVTVNRTRIPWTPS
jgi:hypothetical protein